MKQPNVLWIWTDQQRGDALGAAGNPHIRTPHLDRLAAGGALFTRAFCNSPVSMPSRMSALSGQYPSATGLTCNGIEMPEDLPALQTLLKPHGYRTANLGKLHFLNHASRDHRAPHPDYEFDELVVSEEPGCYEDAYIDWVRGKAPDQVESCRCSTPPAWTGEPVVKRPRNTHQPYLFEGPEELTHSAFVADRTADYLRRHREGAFFAIAGFYAPHNPNNPPERFVDMYDPSTLPLPTMNKGEDRYGLSDEEWRRVKAYYYALVSHVDDQVGRILAALEESALAESTLVIFTSDHGEHLGDHGLVHKGTPGLESCTHVPLILSWPGRIQPGRKHDELVELVDLAPTVLELCGVEVPDSFQGRSLRPLLAGGEYRARRSAYLEHKYPFEESWRAVRTERYRYCVSSKGQELLFDREKDPGELRNVAAGKDYAAELSDCRRELIARAFQAEKQHPLRTGSY